MQPVLKDLELEGGSVLLRPLCAHDAAEAFPHLAGDAQLLRALGDLAPRDQGELARDYARWRRRGRGGLDYHLAVVERASAAFAGTISLRFAGRAPQGELGFWIAAPMQRRGLGTEAVALCVWLAFERLEAPLLAASVREGNLSSRAVLERNGFELAHLSSRTGAGWEARFWHFTRTRAAGPPPPPLKARVELDAAP